MFVDKNFEKKKAFQFKLKKKKIECSACVFKVFFCTKMEISYFECFFLLVDKVYFDQDQSKIFLFYSVLVLLTLSVMNKLSMFVFL